MMPVSSAESYIHILRLGGRLFLLSIPVSFVTPEEYSFFFFPGPFSSLLSIWTLICPPTNPCSWALGHCLRIWLASSLCQDHLWRWYSQIQNSPYWQILVNTAFPFKRDTKNYSHTVFYRLFSYLLHKNSARPLCHHSYQHSRKALQSKQGILWIWASPENACSAPARQSFTKLKGVLKTREGTFYELEGGKQNVGKKEDFHALPNEK